MVTVTAAAEGGGGGGARGWAVAVVVVLEDSIERQKDRPTQSVFTKLAIRHGVQTNNSS